MSFFKLCKRCGQAGKLVDPLGNDWCQACSPRHRLIDLGYTRKFPDLQCPPYAIAAGGYFWFMAAVLGTDDMIETTLKALEEKRDSQ